MAFGVFDSQPLEIGPGGKATTQVKLPRSAYLRAVERKRTPGSDEYIFYYGLVFVEFANGLSWEYDLLNEGNWDWPADIKDQTMLRMLERDPESGGSIINCAGECHTFNRCRGETKEGGKCIFSLLVCCGPENACKKSAIACVLCP